MEKTDALQVWAVACAEAQGACLGHAGHNSLANERKGSARDWWEVWRKVHRGRVPAWDFELHLLDCRQLMRRPSRRWYLQKDNFGRLTWHQRVGW